MEDVSFFDDEVVPLSTVARQGASSEITKIGVGYSDFVATWNFLLLASTIALVVFIAEGLPPKPLGLSFCFVLYVLYALYNYKSEFVFDILQHMLYYRYKVSFVPESVSAIGSLDRVIAIVVDSQSYGYWNSLLLLFGDEAGFDLQSIEKFVAEKRLRGEAEVFKLQEGELESLNEQGKVLAELIGTRFCAGTPGKSYYLGSRYQTSALERRFGCSYLVLLLGGFAMVALVVSWLL